MQRTPRFNQRRSGNVANPNRVRVANGAIIALSALIVAGVGIAALQSQDAQARVAEAVNFYEPPATIPALEVPHRVAIIGDSYTGGSDEGGTGPDNWTAKIQPLIKHDHPISYDVTGLGGSGYVSDGSSDKNFVQAVKEEITPATDVVVIFGSLNDRKFAGSVEGAASAAFEYIEATASKAQIVVVGPPAPYADPTDVDQAIAEEVRSAADGHADVYVDPIADDWFDDESIIGDDEVHPTNKGHEVMAELIAPALNEALNDVAE